MFVAVAVQGMVLDAKAAGVANSLEEAVKLASEKAGKLNAKERGEAEGYVGMVVEV